MNYRREPAQKAENEMWTCMVYEDIPDGKPLLEAWGKSQIQAEDRAKVLTVLWQAARPEYKLDKGGEDEFLRSLFGH